jgi:hypothetical protein
VPCAPFYHYTSEPDYERSFAPTRHDRLGVPEDHTMDTIDNTPRTYRLMMEPAGYPEGSA